MRTLTCVFTLFTLVLFRFNTFSQNIISDDNVVFKKGIYKDFEEFKFNRPSIPLSFKIDTFEYKNVDVYNPKGINHLTFNINTDKQTAKRIGPIFGFCDGNHIFINETNKCLGEKTDFELLQFIGLYSYFEQYMFIQGELGDQNSSTILSKIININNGDVSILTREELITILANDSDLLKKFNKEVNQKSKAKEYIALYSLKHKNDGIYCRDKKMTKQEADSFIIRTKVDKTDSIYYSRLASKLKTNPAFSDAKLEEQFYDNGKRKSIGYNTRCNFDPNDHFLYCVGLWQLFYETGQLKEELFYSISSKQISKKRFDKNGKLIEK